MLPKILVIGSFPPRECGIANYSSDLIHALKQQFNQSFTIGICALEDIEEDYIYKDDVMFTLKTDIHFAYHNLAIAISENPEIGLVLIQHEFGFFKKEEKSFLNFLEEIKKPIITVFHTVLPQANDELKQQVRSISNHSAQLVVMTNNSSKILQKDYQISSNKITVIPHGTHLLSHSQKDFLKEKYKFQGKIILSTFGLISPGKSIETTINALPKIINKHPNVLFLILGKTHPGILKSEGNQYYNSLEARVKELKIDDHVCFINSYQELPVLLEYLQLTDIYLFTSKDPNQAVSGTFSYAMSCGCPIVSTPIPHVLEVFDPSSGLIIDFENHDQLAEAVIKLIENEDLRKTISLNGLQKMAATAWENSAIAHAKLFEEYCINPSKLIYTIPPTNLSHIKKMTTEFGMLQFSKLNTPDLDSGYTLDDNARALIAMCQYFELEKDLSVVPLIEKYLKFIEFCLQKEPYFLNYIDEKKEFTEQNNSCNLADANGRAIWALGYLISISDILDEKITARAESILSDALYNLHKIHSTRAMAFVIKGLYYYEIKRDSEIAKSIIEEFGNRLTQMFLHEKDNDWNWYESYLTYANSVIPEAMLCAFLSTGKSQFKEVAFLSFEFLLARTYRTNRLNVISNKNWLHKSEMIVQTIPGGEQPIDVAYMILAMCNFYNYNKDEKFQKMIVDSFDWFLGNNHLNQIIYNPATGGCYDGLEEFNINLNQGAESTLSYLMAKLALEKLNLSRQNNKVPGTMTQLSKIDV